MLNSNVPENLMNEILALVPDALDDPSEYWRIVPDTVEGMTYSISSKRDIIVKHSTVDRMGRLYRPMLLTMSLDVCVYNTSIRRSRKGLSTYVEHVRYDAFPELNQVKTLDDDINDAVDVPYEGLDWFGRKKEIVHILPVSEEDMKQVRSFYPDDLDREIWAYVPETNRKYVISSQSRGVILKRYRTNGQILAAQIWQLTSGKKNYYECCLTVGDRQLNSVSHAQVLRSFIPKPQDDVYEVNHINGDTHNNMLDNLEWATRQQNSDHYNKSPEMAYRRAIGYKKISEFGKAHQKEIQNRPEVNAKRSATCSAYWTDEYRKQQSEAAAARWQALGDEQKQKQLSGILKCNQEKHEAAVKRAEQNESS